MRGLVALSLLPALAWAAPMVDSAGGYIDDAIKGRGGKCPNRNFRVSFGSRPFYLINNMTESPLKRKLESCENGPFRVAEFTIAHRGGATLQFPEHSKENNMAGFRMGTGVVECDVSFTNDRKLVCRHSLCDLHTTTDILLRPALAAKCTTPFTPAANGRPASALCCTSDITLAEFKTLCAKVDGSNSSATTPQAYQRGGPTWRTDLYNTCGTVLSLEEHIDLVDSQPGFRNFTPELKTPPSQVPMPFKGYTQQQYARDMLDTFIRKGIDPTRVWSQSFLPDDIFQWVKEYPLFARQAVYLDEDGDDPQTLLTAAARLPQLRAKGVNFIAPPINYLLTVDNSTGKIVPSDYAKAAKAADLDIISWTFERSGPAYLVNQNSEYYFSNFASAVSYDGQIYEILDTLIQKVGIVGLFTDWAETVTYYVNCLKVPGPSVASAKRLAAGKYKGLGA